MRRVKISVNAIAANGTLWFSHSSYLTSLSCTRKLGYNRGR